MGKRFKIFNGGLGGDCWESAYQWFVQIVKDESDVIDRSCTTRLVVHQEDHSSQC